MSVHLILCDDRYLVVKEMCNSHTLPLLHTHFVAFFDDAGFVNGIGRVQALICFSNDLTHFPALEAQVQGRCQRHTIDVLKSLMLKIISENSEEQTTSKKINLNQLQFIRKQKFAFNL